MFLVNLPIILWIAHTHYTLENEDVFLIRFTDAVLDMAWPLLICIGLIYGLAYGIAYMLRKFC